jgi:hypothetical protein
MEGCMSDNGDPKSPQPKSPLAIGALVAGVAAIIWGLYDKPTLAGGWTLEPISNCLTHCGGSAYTGHYLAIFAGALVASIAGLFLMD